MRMRAEDIIASTSIDNTLSFSIFFSVAHFPSLFIIIILLFAMSYLNPNLFPLHE